MADLNGDGLADLYEVNYLAEPRFSISFVMRAAGSLDRARPPSSPPNRIVSFSTRVTEHLRSRPVKLGLQSPTERVWDHRRSTGRIPQTEPVHRQRHDREFSFCQPGNSGGSPKFEERAVISGLAYDKNAKAQACMGIAFGDVDGDQHFDIYVTNFFEEYNTLFRQQKDFYYRDESRESRLAQPSRSMLGFGTQFIDGELDGWLDLVIANGHVRRLYARRHLPVSDAPSIYMSNLGNGAFKEIRDTAGGLFRRKLLAEAWRSLISTWMARRISSFHIWMPRSP